MSSFILVYFQGVFKGKFPSQQVMNLFVLKRFHLNVDNDQFFLKTCLK